MKKFISLSVLLCAVFFILPSEINAQSNQGSTYSVSENSRCGSGYMHRCTGSGTTCSLTIGWDCVTNISIK